MVKACSDLHSYKNAKVTDQGQVHEARRILTCFVYLNTLPEGCGGETEFPMLNKSGSGTSFSGQGKKFRAMRGRAAIWSNLLPDGTPDVRSIHRGCKPLNGCKKFGMNVWVTDKEQTDHIMASAGTVNLKLNKGDAKGKKPLMMAAAHNPSNESDCVCGYCASGLVRGRELLVCAKTGCLNAAHTCCLEERGIEVPEEGKWVCCWSSHQPAKKEAGRSPSKAAAKRAPSAASTSSVVTGRGGAFKKGTTNVQTGNVDGGAAKKGIKAEKEDNNKNKKENEKGTKVKAEKEKEKEADDADVAPAKAVKA
eukprot:GHVU01130023.1.p1 GENE.GHVU01130023.1~~GHVU01130023.1.p1  ORF type:complete len:308 (-),score=73.91 GHVU01130023.1:523-1446(-)